MGSHVYLSDNSGNVVSPGAVCVDPIAGSGITLSDAVIGADISQAVEAGARYAITSAAYGFVLGVADVTDAANIIWVCSLYQTIIIQIPVGVTTLHYQGTTNVSLGYMRKLA